MEDTLLTDYKPSDISAAEKAKMISVHPATAVFLRFFGKDTANDTGKIYISGWMPPDAEKGPGPGHRLWSATLTLGAKTWSEAPLSDSKWDGGPWFEVDTIVDIADAVGTTIYAVADQENGVIVPTLGYTHLLFHARDITGGGTEMTEIGILWRPIGFDEVALAGIAATP